MVRPDRAGSGSSASKLREMASTRKRAPARAQPAARRAGAHERAAAAVRRRGRRRPRRCAAGARGCAAAAPAARCRRARPAQRDVLGLGAGGARRVHGLRAVRRLGRRAAPGTGSPSRSAGRSAGRACSRRWRSSARGGDAAAARVAAVPARCRPTCARGALCLFAASHARARRRHARRELRARRRRHAPGARRYLQARGGVVGEAALPAWTHQLVQDVGVGHPRRLPAARRRDPAHRRLARRRAARDRLRLLDTTRMVRSLRAPADAEERAAAGRRVRPRRLRGSAARHAPARARARRADRARDARRGARRRRRPSSTRSRRGRSRGGGPASSRPRRGAAAEDAAASDAQRPTRRGASTRSSAASRAPTPAS